MSEAKPVMTPMEIAGAIADALDETAEGVFSGYATEAERDAAMMLCIAAEKVRQILMEKKV